MELHFLLTLSPRRIIWVTLTFPSIWAKRTELNFYVFISSFYVTGHCSTSSMISIKSLPTCRHEEKNTRVCVAVERRSHSAKNAITLGQCPSSRLFKAANYALPGCENMLPDQGRKGRNLHSPSILTQTFLAAVLPAVQNLNKVCRLNAEILQPSLLLCIFYYFIHNTALFRVHDPLAFERDSFHATLYA